jgi:hypothetical protein
VLPSSSFLSVPDPFDLESRILRALCTRPSAFDPSGTDHASARAARPAILAQLRAHRWQGPEHRVVFEALTLLPGRNVAELRQQLPAQATRMGFPDVNWDHYFAASDDHAEIEPLVAELLNCAKRNSP